MLELGGHPSWCDLTWSNQIRDKGGTFSRSWNYQKLPKNHPNKLFSRKERLRELWKKSSLKKKVKDCVLWNRVILDFSVVSFMTWGKELNGETTIFSDLGYSKKRIRSFRTNITFEIYEHFSTKQMFNYLILTYFLSTLLKVIFLILVHMHLVETWYFFVYQYKTD